MLLKIYWQNFRSTNDLLQCLSKLQTQSNFDWHRRRSFVDRKFCQYIFCNIFICIVAQSSRYLYSIYIYIYTQKSLRLFSERCGLAAFLSGSLLHIYEKQTTWRYNGDKRVYDVDFAEFCLWKVNVDPILCLGLTAQKF